MAAMRLTIDELLKSRLRNRQAMRQASSRIDAFRKRYGRPEEGFDSVKILRHLREAR